MNETKGEILTRVLNDLNKIISSEDLIISLSNKTGYKDLVIKQIKGLDSGRLELELTQSDDVDLEIKNGGADLASNIPFYYGLSIEFNPFKWVKFYYNY